MQPVEIFPLVGFPEVTPGMRLASLVTVSVKKSGLRLRNGDVVVIKQKIVSKSEGRLLELSTVKPGKKAKSLALALGKDPGLVEVILRESARIVRVGHGVIVTKTRHGFVCANSGVDQSNVSPGFVVLLPRDPDRSAALIREGLLQLTSKEVAVIISDTFGRPWREGQTDVAIGSSGIAPLTTYRGKKDPYGYKLRVTEPAVVDEIAAAAELATGKLRGIPAAIVRGVDFQTSTDGVKSMIMPAERDLFE